MRRIVELWFETEIRMRRDDALRDAHLRRLNRMTESGRSTSIRTRIADGAQSLSDALANLARAMRDSQTT
jgi:hypothetical protein